jgi:transcription initiation factor TFIIIB Brf1 subunit/transcription initiation factor TFIIB
MSDNAFQLFTKIIDDKPSIDIKQVDQLCEHTNILSEQGSMLCGDCGLEINDKETQYKEWKYYGLNDSKHFIDPSSCYIRKTKDKTIYQDVQNMNISDHIKDMANDIYVEVCGEKVHRGARRKAIVFASIFHAYKLDNKPKSCESLIKIFKIQRKDALKGLKFVNDNISKNSPIRTIYITPEHIINEYLRKFSVSEDKRIDIIDLYKFVKGKSETLNRSRPQSVASGVIWYWIKTHQRQVGIKEFIKKVDLSELTVTKMAKEVAKLCGNEGII